MTWRYWLFCCLLFHITQCCKIIIHSKWRRNCTKGHKCIFKASTANISKLKIWSWIQKIKLAFAFLIICIMNENLGFIFFSYDQKLFLNLSMYRIIQLIIPKNFTLILLYFIFFRERPEVKNYSKRFVIIWIYWKEITSAWNTKTKTTKTTGYNWIVEYWKVWKVSWYSVYYSFVSQCLTTNKCFSSIFFSYFR